MSSVQNGHRSGYIYANTWSTLYEWINSTRSTMILFISLHMGLLFTVMSLTCELPTRNVHGKHSIIFPNNPAHNSSKFRDSFRTIQIRGRTCIRNEWAYVQYFWIFRIKAVSNSLMRRSGCIWPGQYSTKENCQACTPILSALRTHPTTKPDYHVTRFRHIPALSLSLLEYYSETRVWLFPSPKLSDFDVNIRRCTLSQ